MKFALSPPPYKEIEFITNRGVAANCPWVGKKFGLEWGSHAEKRGIKIVNFFCVFSTKIWYRYSCTDTGGKSKNFQLIFTKFSFSVMPMGGEVSPSSPPSLRHCVRLENISLKIPQKFLREPSERIAYFKYIGIV